MSLVYVLCLAIAFFIVVSSSISSVVSLLTVPESSVIVIEKGVELKCSASENESVIWSFTSWNSSLETNIYWDRNITTSMRTRYKIGQHNLIIDSVDMAHAGRYQCITVIPSVKATAQLTVLASDPVCDANASKEHNDKMELLWIWCRISYTGYMNPIFNWTKSNSSKSYTQYDIAANVTTSGNRAVPLTTTSSFITQLHSDDKGVMFKCKITFQLPNNTVGNVPDYEYTWNYTLYGTRNLTIVRYEDRLECLADGNPTPTYRWTHVETNTSIVGPVFMLNATVTYDREHIFQCTATNIFADENKNTTVQDSGRILDHFHIPASVIGGSLLLLLIIIIVSCVVHRKRRKDGTSDRPDVALDTDLNTYDDIDLSSGGSPNYILDGNSASRRSDDCMIAENLVYAEVKKPKGTREGKRAINDEPTAIYSDVKKKVNVNGSSKGSSGANLGENSQPLQTPSRGNKNRIGADGTVYADLSGVRQPANTAQSASPPVFSRVEVYASIDHNGRAPPPPPKL